MRNWNIEKQQLKNLYSLANLAVDPKINITILPFIGDCFISATNKYKESNLTQRWTRVNNRTKESVKGNINESLFTLSQYLESPTADIKFFEDKQSQSTYGLDVEIKGITYQIKSQVPGIRSDIYFHSEWNKKTDANMLASVDQDNQRIMINSYPNWQSVLQRSIMRFDKNGKPFWWIKLEDFQSTGGKVLLFHSAIINAMEKANSLKDI